MQCRCLKLSKSCNLLEKPDLNTSLHCNNFVRYCCCDIIAVRTGVPAACDKATGSAMAASGYIGSVQTAESSRGGPLCPWIIAAQSGQVINITLINFSRLLTAPTGLYIYACI